jgi:hypothetical protein
MVYDFHVTKKAGTDGFILHTGVALDDLEKHTKDEFDYLIDFYKSNEFYIPRHKLCELLDKCFDHFSEDSLIHITKLLNQPSETLLKNEVMTRSVSKRSKPKDPYAKKREEEARKKEEERQERERIERERERERIERERQQQEDDRRERERLEEAKREREDRERREREAKEREDRERRERERAVVRREQDEDRELSRMRKEKERDRVKHQVAKQEDLNYEILPKHELLKMLSTMRAQLDSIEQYVKQNV